MRARVRTERENMNAQELNRLADMLALRGWRGALHADRIRNLPVGCSAVVNCCDTASRAGGHHWVAVFRRSRQRLELFGASGLHPAQFRRIQMPPHTRLTYSRQRVQHAQSSTCGVYAVYFCWLRSRGRMTWNFLHRDFSSNNLAANDRRIIAWCANVIDKAGGR